MTHLQTSAVASKSTLSKHILPLIQLTKKRRELYQQSQSYSHHPQHKIFTIIEILEIIFSFLDQSTLRHIVGLVCRTWHSASRRYLMIVTTWVDTCSAPQRDATLSELSLGVTAVFKIESRNRKRRNTTPLLQRETEENRLTLHNHIKELTLEGKQWFREVVLEYVNDLQRELYPLIPYFQTVTSIRLDNSTQRRICLHTILTGCLALRNLEIKSVMTTDYYRPSKLVRNEDAPTLPITLRLRRLAISEMLLHQPALETILASTPYLSELSLIGIRKTSHDTKIPNFDRVSFLEFVSGSCPEIESLHFSFKDTKTFENDHELERHLSLFPVLHSFSFTSKDATTHMLRLTQTLYQNRLTTLEIVKIGATPLFLFEALYLFLCSSPQLLHLKAPHIKYYTEYLNMIDPESVNNSELRRSAEALRNAWKLHSNQEEGPRIWACRNLRTLHLEFGEFFGSQIPQAPIRSRIIFGYIAKVCPKIQDLYIRRPNLNLKLEGGWCLLSQLKELSQLRIETMFLDSMTENDLAWMSKSTNLSNWQKVRYQVLAKRLRAAESVHSGIRFSMGCFQRHRGVDMQVEEVRAAGGLDRVADVLQKTSSLRATTCWPELELLEVFYSDHIGGGVPLAAYIHSVRPEVRLRV
ncbi:hypothetical protein BGZ80_010882, partial [Entomortierella chlamydospora]